MEYIPDIFSFSVKMPPKFCDEFEWTPCKGMEPKSGSLENVP